MKKFIFYLIVIFLIACFFIDRGKNLLKLTTWGTIYEVDVRDL